MVRIVGIPGIALRITIALFVLVYASGTFAAGDAVSRYGISLQFIEGAEFERGGPFGCTDTAPTKPCEKQSVYDEEPRHAVTVSDFYLCRTEITTLQWARVMGEVEPPRDQASLPKTNISWDEAQVFLARVSELDGRTFRLPTEAEWEYAATAKIPGKIEGYAWYRQNSSKQIQPVARLKPNDYGVYDMLGNVWEWTSDWYGEEYYRKVSVQRPQDPQGPADGQRRVVRGGAFNSVVSYVRHGVRMGFAPNTKSAFTGFRCAVSAAAKK